MGLFDKLVGNRDISLTPQAGLLLSAMVMIAIDGDVDDDELSIIRRLDRSDKTDAWDSALKAWKAKSRSECIQLSAGSMNSEQRLTTIANLIDIAMADGVLVGAEQQLLEDFVKAFEISREKIEQIVNVISIKNNKSIFQ
jgi:uncharacterized tellurite resistance protein B-like protein